MANWCSNAVEFRGERGKLDTLENLFKAMLAKGRIEDKGQLPEFVQSDVGYFFELELSLFPTVFYETRWVPNTDVVKQIADHFDVEFVQEYAEPMNGVKGEAHYFGGLLLTMDDD
jgi:hypothetical protein